MLIIRTWFVVLLALGLIGCESAPTLDSFQRYQSTFAELREAAEGAIAQDAALAKESFDTEVVDADRSDYGVILSGLRLEFRQDNAPFGWSSLAAPLYLAILESSRKLRNLHDIYAEYLSLLSDLSAGSVASAEAMEGRIGRLNENAKAVFSALGAEVSKKYTAVFSLAAGEAAKAYVDNQRREALVTVLAQNQSSVEQFAQLGRDLARLIAVDIKAEYQDRWPRLARGAIDADGQKRLSKIAELQALNDMAINQLHILERVDRGYALLPVTHARLRRAVEISGEADFSDLIRETERLSKIYKGLLGGEAK